MLRTMLTAVLCSLAPVAVAHAQLCDYEPTVSEEFLNTDFTWVTPKNCAPYMVTGGVFVFRNVTINPGVIVRGLGNNPMIWIVLGDFTVHGHLRVDGGDGASVASVGGANFPTAAGQGQCNGGDGGRGSPNTIGQSITGEFGFGPWQTAAAGGRGGLLGLVGGCGRGSGGGGGVFATAGDPYYKIKARGNSFLQQLGVGGFGCFGPSGSPSRTLQGGLMGPSPFVDGRPENDFFGTALDLQRGVIIQGELPYPVGGAGGGGGGDRAAQLGSQNWTANSKGGGGGGGGGALIVLAAGKIRVTGLISANGGNGGGGELSGSNTEGGGGGGGSGGMIVLYSLDEIVLHTHGETYARNDYVFSLSADGGVGAQGPLDGVEILSKYPPPVNGAVWDDKPSGAMGGLGVIQLCTRPGNNADGTNTILDDNITILKAGQPLTGSEKIRYLAWRGFPNAQGVWVDDNDDPTYSNPSHVPAYPAWATTRDDEGDIRPAPVLLPIL